MLKNQNYKYNKNYIGIILSAGKSKRLKEKLNIKSKNLIEIKNGKTSLDYNIEKLEKIGIEKIFINTHHHHKLFTRKLKVRKPNNNRIKLINEKKILGTAGGVLNICSKFPEYKNVIVLYGDNISKINLKNIIKRHEGLKSFFSVVVYKLKDFKNSGVVKFDTDHIITSFVEKKNSKAEKNNWVNSGIYIINKKILTNFKVKNSDFAKDIIPFILEKKITNIYAIKTSLRVFTIDNFDLMKKSKKEINF